MALPVDVRSVQYLSDFRASLCRFGEDAKGALTAVEMEINRMVDWLANDRRLYWEAEIRRRREDVARAQSELFRKRTSRMFGHEGAFSEQRDVVRQAKERLEVAEKKLLRVRQWVQPLQQAVMDYRSTVRPLSDMLDFELPRALSLLERMIRALEEYSASGAPTTAYVQSFRARGDGPTSDVVNGARVSVPGALDTSLTENAPANDATPQPEEEEREPTPG